MMVNLAAASHSLANPPWVAVAKARDREEDAQQRSCRAQTESKHGRKTGSQITSLSYFMLLKNHADIGFLLGKITPESPRNFMGKSLWFPVKMFP